MIKETLGAAVIVGEDKLNTEIEHIYASDLMSDVLAFGKPDSILLTGLASQQAIISAHMAEFKGIVLIRAKKTKDGSEKFARDNNLILLSTELDMYDACVELSLVFLTSVINPGTEYHGIVHWQCANPISGITALKCMSCPGYHVFQ